MINYDIFRVETTRRHVFVRSAHECARYTHQPWSLDYTSRHGNPFFLQIISSLTLRLERVCMDKQRDTQSYQTWQRRKTPAECVHDTDLKLDMSMLQLWLYRLCGNCVYIFILAPTTFVYCLHTFACVLPFHHHFPLTHVFLPPRGANIITICWKEWIKKISKKYTRETVQ